MRFKAHAPRVLPGRRGALRASAGFLKAARSTVRGLLGRYRPGTIGSSEARFRLQAENARDIIYIYRLSPEDARGFEYVSPSAHALIGYTPEQFVADPGIAESLVHPEDRRLFEEILASPESTLNLRVRRGDGEWMHAELRNKLVLDRRGAVVAVEGIGRDVTERVRAEEELRRAETRLREAFEEAPVGMALVRPDGSYFKVNKAFCKIFGYDEATLLEGKTWAGLTHPDDLEKSRELAGRNLAGEFDSYHLEKRYVRGDGEPIWVSLDVSLVRDEGGAPKHYVIKVQDVTRERHYKEALERATHRNELILRSAAEGIFGLDREGRAVFVNPAGARMIGHRVEDLIGRVMHDVCHHTTPDGSPYPREECAIYRALGSGEAHSVSHELFFRADGTSFPVEYESTPIEEAGKIVGAVVTFRDITERRRDREALGESEERYRRLVDLSPNAIAIHADGHYVYVNRASEKLFGASAGEIVGLPLLDLVHPDYKEEAARRVTMAPNSAQRAKPYAQKLIRLDGEEIDVEVVGVPISYEGRPARQIVIRDITERKKAEEALSRSEARLRAVLDTAFDAIVTASGDGEILSFNRRAESVFGYRSEEVVGRSLSELMPDHVRERHERGELTYTEEGEVGRTLEVRGKRKNGEVFPMELSIAETVDEEGEDRVYTGIIRDITERKESEEALVQSEERFRLLAENTTDLVCLHEPESGRYLYVSPSVRRLLGYEPEELLGRDPYDLVHPEDVERLRTAVHTEVLRGVPAVSTTYRMRRKGGDYAWLETVIQQIADGESGRIERLQSSSRDVGERRRAEEALVEATRARADFLADVSHELRTPLTVVRGNAEVALKLSRGGLHAPFLEEILNEADSMGRMVEDLLFLARSDSTETPFDLRPVSAAGFLSGLRPHAEVLAQKRGAVLETRLDDATGALRADPTRLEQAVLALVDNAAKYGSEGAAVRLLSKTEGRTLVVEVRDTGPGIPEDDLPRVFERFYRSEGPASGAGKKGGTGLGLAIARSVVEAHGGRIEAESRLGEGTTMRVRLPLSTPPEQDARRNGFDEAASGRAAPE